MKKEERVKLMFETISKIAGFEIKPDKEFYIIENGIKIKHYINENLILMRRMYNGIYLRSDYSIFLILNGDFKLEEIKELLADEEKEFLRNFAFDSLKKVEGRAIIMFTIQDHGGAGYALGLNALKLRFEGLEFDKEYTKEELKINERKNQAITSIM
jgi:hypothetical protein